MEEFYGNKIKNMKINIGASFSDTDEEAIAKDNETYTGCKNAGTTLATNTSQKLPAKADITLQIKKVPKDIIIIVLRLYLDNNKGNIGPDTATAKANKLTNKPATDISIL